MAFTVLILIERKSNNPEIWSSDLKKYYIACKGIWIKSELNIQNGKFNKESNLNLLILGVSDSNTEPIHRVHLIKATEMK